jgi:hypothetical protein
MTKYKSLYRAVQHLTATDHRLNGRVTRRTAHRAVDHYGKSIARHHGRVLHDQMSAFAFLRAPDTAAARSVGDIRGSRCGEAAIAARVETSIGNHVL